MGAHTLAGTRTTRNSVSTSLSERPTRAFVGIQARDVPVLITALGGVVFGLSANVLVFIYAFTGGLSV